MEPERRKKIGDVLIEEFYWNGEMVVYVNNRATGDNFEDAIYSTIDVRGVWHENELFWEFSNDMEIVREVSDNDLRVWLNRSDLFDEVDLPCDGGIKEKHTRAYIMNEIIDQ